MALLKDTCVFSGECSKKHGKQLPSEQQNKEMTVNEKPYIKNEKSSNNTKMGYVTLEEFNQFLDNFDI